MAGVCRLGDQNDGQGRILEGVSSVLVNGKPVAVVGGKISPHGKGKHAAAVVQQGNGSVLAGGKPITYIGAMDDCGHSHISGSSDVNVG